MHTRALPFTLLAGATLGVILGGCHKTRHNPEHCFYAEGDLTCAQLDESLPYCAAPDCSADAYGCVAELPASGCYSPCGDATLAEEDASCVEIGGDTDTSSEAETGEGSGAEQETGSECESHTDCPGDAPYCLQGDCVACDATPEPAEACFALTNGDATVCFDGECVECTIEEPEACTDDALVCDARVQTCTPCTAHDQCAGGAGCDVALGLCLPPDAVWHVDGDGGQDFETIADALAAIGEGSGTIILHELDASAYAEGISVGGDRALVVLGAEGELPHLDTAAVSVEALDGARVYARKLLLNGDDAAHVIGAHLELDQVRLAPTLVSALAVEDGVLRMRNCMARSGLGPEPVVDIAGVSDVDIRYSTLLGFGDQAAVLCSGATLVPGSQIRNSILVNLGSAPAVQCASPSYAGNGLEDATGFSNNTTIGDASVDWFQDLLLADFHLEVVAPIAIVDAAVWSAGDPLVDFDGDPRPGAEGVSDFAGADIP